MRRLGLQVLGMWVCFQVFLANPGVCQYANPAEEAPYQKSSDDYIKDGGKYFRKDSSYVKSESPYFPKKSAYFPNESPYVRKSQNPNVVQRIVNAVASLFN